MNENTTPEDFAVESTPLTSLEDNVLFPAGLVEGGDQILLEVLRTHIRGEAHSETLRLFEELTAMIHGRGLSSPDRGVLEKLKFSMKGAGKNKRPMRYPIASDSYMTPVARRYAPGGYDHLYVWLKEKTSNILDEIFVSANCAAYICCATGRMIVLHPSTPLVKDRGLKRLYNRLNITLYQTHPMAK